MQTEDVEERGRDQRIAFKKLPFICNLFPFIQCTRIRNRDYRISPFPFEFIWRGQGYDWKWDFISNTKYNFILPIFNNLIFMKGMLREREENNRQPKKMIR